MSDVYKIAADSGAYYLKVYMQVRRTRQDIEEEVDFLNYLRKQNIRVSIPAQKKDGFYLIKLNAPEGVRYAILFHSAKGTWLDSSKMRHCISLGHTVARMHIAADNIKGTYKREPIDLNHLVDKQLMAIKPFMTGRKRDFDFISSIGRDAKEEILKLLKKEKPYYGLCHGDLHSGDSYIDNNGNVTLFDFDSFGYGYRALDIGVFPASYEWMDVSMKAKKARKRKWEAFLKGYQKERILSKNELKAAQLCAPVRHIYLMGVPLKYWSEYDGHHWIDDNYFNWHMDWFKSWQKEGEIMLSG